ncbi:hypothetical protein HYE23_00685 [Mycoplasmopsis bovis]|nr:hypothetical protein [Mycoplasmopsis bovis]QQH23830.1 hypothetical protein HYE23_00685 [Mycoplasmopsis bovis]
MLKKQDKLGNVDRKWFFDFKLEKNALLNRKGEISITSKSKSEANFWNFVTYNWPSSRSDAK